EQAPGSMPLPWLAEHRALHGTRVLGGGGRVAELGVSIADEAERGRVERDHDARVAVVDHAPPVASRRLQSGESREQPVVAWKDGEPRPKSKICIGQAPGA